VTASCVQLVPPTASTALLVASPADSSHLQLKAPKFAPVPEKIVHILQKMPLAVVKQDSTSIRPKESVRVNPVPMPTAFQSFTTCASKVRLEVQQVPVFVQPIAQRNARQATEQETQFQVSANVTKHPALTKSATRIAETTHLSQLCPQLVPKLPWFKMEQPLS